MTNIAVKVVLAVTSFVISELINGRRPPRPPNMLTLEETIDKARVQLDMDVINYLNFAFCGPQASGKSTLINSLRALPDPDADADPIAVEQHDVLDSAQTGETETTRDTRCYGYPVGHELEFVRLWDHPGCGTQNHPVVNYFVDNVLYAFDCVLLITTGGLGEYERKIIESARMHGTDVVIVVNQAEQRVESKIRRRPRNAGPLNKNARRVLIQETIDEAKESINNDLANIQHNQVPVFVVSGWKWYDYQSTQDINDMEMAMEIRPLFEHLINVALARREP